MRHAKLITLTLISLFGMLSLFSSLTWAEAKEIVIIRYRIEPLHFQDMVDQFKNTLSKRGYKEGVDVRYVDILTNTADDRSIPEVLKAVQRHKDTASLFVTCGWVSLYARQELKDSKALQLFVPVLESVARELLPSLTATPETNLSGVYLMYPPEKILKITRFLLPDLKRYAYVYDSSIPADISFKKAYETLAPFAKHGISVNFIDLNSGIENTKKQLIEGHIEAFGGIVGAFQHRKELAETNIPMITSFTLDIPRENLPQYLEEGNVLAGLFNPFGACGETAGMMAADIFDKKTTIQKLVPQPARQVSFINLQAARRLNIYVSFEALDSVDFVLN